MRAMTRWAAAAALAVACGAPAGAQEGVAGDLGPVSLRARYRFGAAGEANAALTLGDRDTIPKIARASTEPGADEVRLLDLALHLNQQKLQALGTGTLEDFRVLVYRGDRDGTERQIASREYTVAQLAAADQPVLTLTEDLEHGLDVLPLTVVVRAEFSPALLCAFEASYRATKGTPRAQFRSLARGGVAVPVLDKVATAAKGQAQATATALPDRVIAVESPAGNPVELLFSFCAAGNVDWEKAAEDPHYALGDGPLRPHELSDLHKARLVSLLVEAKLLSPFERGGLAVKVAPPDPADRADRPHRRTRVFVESTLAFQVVPTPHPFTFRESGPNAPGDRDKALGDERLMDQASRIAAVSERGCPAYGPPLSFRVRRLADQASPVLAKVVGAGCQYTLDVDLKRFLGEDIEVAAVYEFPADRFSPPGKRTVVLAFVPQVKVANLGLIATFPVVSELVSAANAKSTKDISSTSSIPISWVFGIAGNEPGDMVAVTFPWKLSYNSRRAPDLAKYFAVYPHVSVLFPLASGTQGGSATGAKLAVGLGVSVAQVFDFAWAVRPGATQSAPAHHLLVGVSIPDIVKLLQAH